MIVRSRCVLPPNAGRSPCHLQRVQAGNDSSGRRPVASDQWRGEVYSRHFTVHSLRQFLPAGCNARQENGHEREFGEREFRNGTIGWTRWGGTPVFFGKSAQGEERKRDEMD